jgi:hypothetical protein
MGAVVIASLVIPVAFMHSKDKKWLKQMRKAEKQLALAETNQQQMAYHGYNQASVEEYVNRGSKGRTLLLRFITSASPN